jgi:hypothetical protein
MEEGEDADERCEGPMWPVALLLRYNIQAFGSCPSLGLPFIFLMIL